MESVALYSFQATESDELAFNKGDTLKVGWPEQADLAPHGMRGLGTRAPGSPPDRVQPLQEDSPASPVISYVILDKSPPPSEPRLPRLGNAEIINDPSFRSCCEDSRRP